VRWAARATSIPRAFGVRGSDIAVVVVEPSGPVESAAARRPPGRPGVVPRRAGRPDGGRRRPHPAGRGDRGGHALAVYSKACCAPVATTSPSSTASAPHRRPRRPVATTANRPAHPPRHPPPRLTPPEPLKVP
jgi:hypothetical protein